MNSLAEGATIDLVVFEASGWRIGFEARRVRASRRVTETGPAYPTVESLLALPVSQPSAKASQCLTLVCPDGERDMLIRGTVELLSVATEFIHPLPPLIAARNYLTGLRALILWPDRPLVLLFDTDALPFPMPH